VPVDLTAWPPAQDAVLTVGTELFAGPVLDAIPIDPEAWRDAETSAWALWRVAFESGVRMAGIDAVVARLVLQEDAEGPAGPVRRPDPVAVAGGRRGPATGGRRHARSARRGRR
jgi:hypothetical protein